MSLSASTAANLCTQLYHRFNNQSLMLTIRAKRKAPEVNITKEGADIAVYAAMDVYVICNSSENSAGTDMGEDSVCVDTTPLALTLGIVSPHQDNIFFRINFKDVANNLFLECHYQGSVLVEQYGKWHYHHGECYRSEVR